MNTNSYTSVRDALFEQPGPKTKRLVSVLTSISLVVLAAFVASIVLSLIHI